MPKPYSLDFRQKIVETYEKGGISQVALAQRFGVAKSFVQKLLDQKRLTGSISPKKRLKQTPPKLNEEHRQILRQLVTEKNDATLAELCEEIEKRTQIHLAVSTMHRTLKQMGYSFKKKRFIQIGRPQQQCNKPDVTSGHKRERFQLRI